MGQPLNFDPDKIMNPAEDFEYQLQAEKEFQTASATQDQAAAATYTDPNDGTVYEWDAQRKGWFPKV